MHRVRKYSGTCSEILMGLHKVLSEHYGNFPGLYQKNICIGIFHPGQRYPAISINPNLDSFVGWLSGGVYYVMYQYNVDFYVDISTKNPERVLFEYAKIFTGLLRDFGKFEIVDRNGRKQTLNYSVRNVKMFDEEELGSGKEGYRLNVPVQFVSKNKVYYAIEPKTSERFRIRNSDEEVLLYIFDYLRGFRNSELANVRSIYRVFEEPFSNGTVLRLRIDSDALERTETSIDKANLSIACEVLTPLKTGHFGLFENVDTAEKIVELLMLDPNVGNYAENAYWENTAHGISLHANSRAYFVSEILWMVKAVEEIQLKYAKGG